MSDEDTEAMMTRLRKLDLDEMLRTGDGARLVERLVNTQAVLSTSMSRTGLFRGVCYLCNLMP